MENKKSKGLGDTIETLSDEEIMNQKNWYKKVYT